MALLYLDVLIHLYRGLRRRVNGDYAPQGQYSSQHELQHVIFPPFANSPWRLQNTAFPGLLQLQKPRSEMHYRFVHS